ncbi:MAG: 3-deoxy-D-manno-octulosonate 8-phosphate phosphatase, partial [Flavobacteriaceae bacterium]|nr:3-deoxy-D-manno-octulosonate 8-phosphate phosphatase [Flavobacteriaceae bacterium]
EVREISDYISHKKGGEGCVRDIIEQTLKVQRNWNFSKKNQNI